MGMTVLHAEFDTGRDSRGFAVDGERDRLSRVALEAYRRLAKAWDLSGAEAAALLGVSLSTWERLKSEGRQRSLSQDQMTRISALVGIYKGLHLLFADSMADRWPMRVNRGPLFDHRSPVAAMIEGGIPHMLDVRRHVDALRGGL